MEFGVEKRVASSFMLIVLFSVFTAASVAFEFQVDSTNLRIYRDGVVRVTQTLVVNETVPAVNLTLLASPVDNVIVLDENQTVLDYEVEGTNVTVFTLGATQVSLQYDTHSLTKKEFDVWSLVVDAPYNLTVHLPEEGEIIYLNEMPDSIETEDDKITLSLSSNEWEVSYILPLTTPSDPPDNGEGSPVIPWEYLVPVILVIGLSLFLFYILVKRRRGFDVEKILEAHPRLRKEDRDVIRFLAEKDGKAFEAEIRQRFPDIPRTSLWRLVRRLERLEIVTIKKVGHENRVQLKK